MIYVYMNGRLGNQLFRYAFSRQLHKHNPKEQIVYNFDAIYRQHHCANDGYENMLKELNTKGTEVQDEANYSVIQYAVWKVFNRFYPRSGSFYSQNRYERKWIPIMKFFGMYFFTLGYVQFPLKKPWWIKNLIVNGAFESDKYLEGLSDELQKDFVPKCPLDIRNNDLMDVIKHTNSVAICVRRGDYVDVHPIKDRYFVCDKMYYERAMSEILKQVTNPVFIFFSNDIQWVKNTIKIDGYPCYYESGNNPVWETLKLMSSCKHFIISNSTLHWLGQYLSKSKNKVVIAPSRWYNDDFKSDLYQDNWTLIDV